MFDAFHLPGLEPDDVEGWETGGLEPGRWRVPILRPGVIARICGALRARQSALAARPIREIVRAIDRAATILADHGHPLRRQTDAVLPAATGYAPAMVALILDRALANLRAPALERLLAAELPQPLMLDGFHLDPTRGHAVCATGPALTTHVLAGNVPGVAVTSVVRALLVKSASFAKTSHREPVLTPAFARALAHTDPDLADCIAVSWWAGTDLQRTREAASAADAIVCYGGREAVDGIRSLAPRDALFLEHGPRISFGLVAREALNSAESTRTTADAVARATALLDQQGCVSPQLVYVETGGHLTPKLFARLVADRLMDLQDTLPRGTLDAAEAAAIHAFRASAEFREISGENIELIAPADTSFTVLFETDPTFLGTPLNRVLRIKEVSDLGIVPGLLHPFRTLLQTAAFAAPPARIAALAPRLVAAGVTRMTSFEDMPFPPPFWHHDGRGPLRELLRFSDLES